MASQKQEYINYIDKEITSGKYSGDMKPRLSIISPPSNYDAESKSLKKAWDAAMMHCRTWCGRIDEFNHGDKLKRIFKS